MEDISYVGVWLVIGCCHDKFRWLYFSFFLIVFLHQTNNNKTNGSFFLGEGGRMTLIRGNACHLLWPGTCPSSIIHHLETVSECSYSSVLLYGLLYGLLYRCTLQFLVVCTYSSTVHD